MRTDGASYRIRTSSGRGRTADPGALPRRSTANRGDPAVVAENASLRREFYSVGGGDSLVTSCAIRAMVGGGARDRFGPGQ